MAYAGWMALLFAVYYAVPSFRPAAWGVLGVSAVAAIAAGVILNSPAHRAPWLLMAGALLAFTASQVGLLALTSPGEPVTSFPPVLGAASLLALPLYAVGLGVFIRRRTGGPRRRSLLDALILTVGVALLVWLYAILPYARSPSLSLAEKAFSIAYPLGNLLVLAMLAWLLAPGFTSTRPGRLIAAGTAGMLASGFLDTLIHLHHTFRIGTAADAGWLICYAAWGSAALDPAMGQVAEPAPQRRGETSALRLVLLTLASLIAPGVLFIGAVRGIQTDAAAIAVFSALLYLLVLWRLADVAASHRLVLGRERVLREAAASLASAVMIEEISAAVSRAASALTGRYPQPDVLLTVREADILRPVGAVLRPLGAARGELPLRRGQLHSLLTEWLPSFHGASSQLVPPPGRKNAVPGGLTEREYVLLCPMSLPQRPSGDPLIGALAVAGPGRRLSALAQTFETLAHQAALALERVTLSHEVTRRNSETYFRTLVQDTSDIILIVADDGKVSYATPSAMTIFGDVSVEGAYISDLVRPAERAAISRSLAHMRASGCAGGPQTWRITPRDRPTVEAEVRFSDLRQDPTVGGLVLTLRDVTQQRKLERELAHQAFHDALTGLPNRVLFTDRIGHLLTRARRDGTTVGVLFVDLDDLKVVNDTMGHGTGDELLVATAARLTGLVRETDTAARLGGDEFALLIEQAAGTTAVETFAARVVEAFGEPFALSAGSVISTATVGIATTEDSTDACDLLRHADLALYAAKAAGKRQWRRYTPILSVGMAKRRELQTAIGEAVAESAFTLAYQPIVALASGEVAGFEALLRWPHPRWGMIHPEEFITLAEETGHIVPLGAWVLERAITDILRWQAEAPRQPPLYVSVNVSARQFTNPGFVAGVRHALDASGLDPATLLLELTESVLLRRDDRIRAELIDLKEIGVRLAIDDFGTGYSSLGYLRELPIDVLKIDKSFIEGIAVSPQRLAIVEVIIKIARTLGLTVMAEGIESDAQRDLLISLGCEFGQGYLLNRPLAAAEAEALARAGSVPELRAAGS